jgi:hypothetical protein
MTAAELTPWRVAGSYFESCSCDPICPCRRIDGRAGGRSTHGFCMGVLSWLIGSGQAGAVDLSGLAVALATWYDDDEPGSPWSVVLYLDQRGDPEQLDALEQIYLGRLGGNAVDHFPWAWKPSNVLGVRAVPIEVDHEPRRQWLRIRDRVSVRIDARYDGPETVTCVIPGHERTGEELVAGELRVDDDALQFAYTGVCGYGSDFDYRSTES